MIEDNRSSVLKPVRQSHTTLTRITAETIQKAIETGDFPYGSKLPNEQQLMQMLEVSRTTLREAILILEELELVKRKRGAGTFVTERSILKDLSQNYSVSSMIQQAGYTLGIEQSEICVEPPPPMIAKELALKEGEKCIIVERIRHANTIPAVYSIDYLPEKFADAQQVKDYLGENPSLYNFLHTCLGISIVKGIAIIKPILAKSNEAKMLEVKPGTPLMSIAQTDYTIQEQPIVYAIEIHLPNLFTFKILRKGPHI